jgi:hypothetical protein
MKKSLYEYLNTVYLEYNDPTNLQKTVNNNLFNFLINFCELWNKANDYIDFKKSQNIVIKTLKDIYRIFVNPEVSPKEMIESSIMTLKNECISFLNVIIEKNKIEKIISDQDEEKIKEIINDLNSNQKILDIKFISFLLNKYTTIQLSELYNWEIRTKMKFKINILNKTTIKFNNLVKSEYLKKLKTVEN